MAYEDLLQDDLQPSETGEVEVQVLHGASAGLTCVSVKAGEAPLQDFDFEAAVRESLAIRAKTKADKEAAESEDGAAPTSALRSCSGWT